MTNIIIVEDQKMIRNLLEGYIANVPEYSLAASVPGACQAAELCDCMNIDLVLMDVQTEHRESGLSAAEKIKKHHPNIKIVIVTSLVDYDVLKKAKIVADSFWYKDTDEATLMNIIRLTLLGEHIFPDAPHAVEIGTAMSTEFTKSELKVLRYLVRGLSYGKIAEAMGIEVTTVKYHIANMLQKTNFENKLQLALAVSSSKLIAELADD